MSLPRALRLVLGAGLLFSCASTTATTGSSLARPDPASAPPDATAATAADAAGTEPLRPDSGAPDAEPDAPPADAPTTLASDAALEPAAAAQQAYLQLRPVLDRYCARCHTTGGANSWRVPMQHFNMDRYPVGGHHTRTITETLRRVFGIAGGAATMPRDRPGAVQGEELRLVAAWADAVDRASPPARR